jgi:RNA methyltransferase, TrmH family
MKMIDSLQNASVKKWKKLHTKKERDKSNTFLIEGFHLIEEAVKSETEITDIIVEQDAILPKQFNFPNVTFTYVSKQVMKAISETETPQGIAAICKKDNVEHIELTSESKLLIIDRVQDPGNVGTMIRTADAAGMDGVILGKGCADLYNSKTVRATQGSLFHLPILTSDITPWFEKIKEKQIPIYGTALVNGVPYQNVNPTKSFALIVGNEGVGVEQELLEKTDKNLYVPIYGKAESLNVSLAAGILLYYLRG